MSEFLTLINETEKKADEIRANSHAQAEALKAEAQEKADSLIEAKKAEAHKRGQEILSAAIAEAEEDILHKSEEQAELLASMKSGSEAAIGKAVDFIFEKAANI